MRTAIRKIDVTVRYVVALSPSGPVVSNALSLVLLMWPRNWPSGIVLACPFRSVPNPVVSNALSLVILMWPRNWFSLLACPFRSVASLLRTVPVPRRVAMRRTIRMLNRRYVVPLSQPGPVVSNALSLVMLMWPRSRPS